MNRTIRTAASLLLLILLLAGCSTYTLNDAAVRGPAGAPEARTVRDLDRGAVVVRPWLATGDEERVVGTIGDEDDSPSDFVWTVPANEAGASLDLFLGCHAALVLDGSIAWDDDDDYRGGGFGLAFFDGGEGALAWRLDVGAAWRETVCELDVIVDPSGSDPETRVLGEKASQLITSAMLTCNTRFDSPYGLYLNAGFGDKEYFDYDDAVISATSDKLDFSGGYFFWGPGAFADLDDSTRVLAGVRFFRPGDIDGDVGATTRFTVQIDRVLGR